jgi:hypothetical protein
METDDPIDEVLIKARTLESFQKPSDRNYRSVRRYHHNTKPLMDAEMDSIRCKEDIVSLHNGREWASFDGGVETVIGQVDRFLKKVFRTKTPPLQVCAALQVRELKTDNYNRDSSALLNSKKRPQTHTYPSTAVLVSTSLSTYSSLSSSSFYSLYP